MTATNLGFTQPTPLDPATTNAWGAILNENFTLIDQAVSGVLSLDVSASVDVNLTHASGTPSQSRNARFVFSGTLTANVTIYFPAGMTIGGSVLNNTTGAFTLAIACGATPTPLGTTVAAPQGGNFGFFCDGTNISRSNDLVGLNAQAGGGAVAGDSRKAAMTVAALSATATFTADAVVVATALGGTIYSLYSYSQAINLATTGAGGMDTGLAPVNGFVALYAIYKPSTLTASIMACNAATSSGTIYSGANLPSGYTASALIGIWPTGALRQFLPGTISGRNLWFAAVVVLSSAKTTQDFVVSAAVPPAAISWSGYALLIYTDGPTAYGLATVSANAALVGAVEVGGYATNTGGSTVPSPIPTMPFTTAQTATFTYIGGATGRFNVYANGYAF